MTKRKKTHHRPPNREAGQHARMRTGPGASGDAAWLFGQHAVLAALANPERQCRRLLVTAEAREHVESALQAASTNDSTHPAPETVDRDTIDRHLPEGSVHQGMALLASPLDPVHIEDALRRLEEMTTALIVVIDQGTDPRNVGAILRSAAAFGADGVIVPDRHAPEVTGVLAKAASGALETVPMIRVTNLSRSLEQLKESGFWAVGLDGEGTETMDNMEWPARTALVLGAEGKGLRRLTRENCDYLVRIPMTPVMESLNLSNAAAIALYEVYRQRIKSKK